MGLTNWRKKPAANPSREGLASSQSLLRKVSHARYSMYAAPSTSMGPLMRGIRAARALQKAVHSTMTMEKPAQMPRLKGRAPRKPRRLPSAMDMRLLGAGVTAVTTA